MRNLGRIGIAVLLLVGPALADERIASTDVREVCAEDGLPGSAYSRAHRTYRHGRAGFEHDHIVPLCAGGADTEANLQWQPLDEARLKDRLESMACRMVCRGQIGLAEAQGWFLGNWRAAYRRVFGEEPR